MVIVFCASVLLVIHSYLFFPLILKWMSRGKGLSADTYKKDDPDIPGVSILLAVYNEESVIREKILSTFQTNYPLHKIEMLIGSDASSDRTNEIVEEMSIKYPGIVFKKFSSRTGKITIINELSKLAKNKIFILTDANVFFNSETIFELVKNYKQEAIALVGGNIINPEFKKEGISYQEKSYLSRENIIKYQEGVIWGSMIGATGGCYSIRSDRFTQVPAHFLVDDFFISMNVLRSGGKCINELNAVCFEDVSNKIREEFRRKVRISSGNFQNLIYFWRILFSFSPAAFCFFSHKVIRWFGPVLILLAFASNLFLYKDSNFFQKTLFLQGTLFLIPMLDWVLKRVHIHINLFRFISHFYLMNLALLLGFFKFMVGIKGTSIWTPTQRNQ